MARRMVELEEAMSDAYDSTRDTKDHIGRVRYYLSECIETLGRRADVHDASKLQSPEKEAFDVLTPRLAGLTYGSDEYRASLRELKPAIEHHYARNSHHPEHWPNGVNDMSLLDVLEMLIDWKAASERHDNGNIWTSIDHNQERFGLSDQLTAILRNTARELGW